MIKASTLVNNFMAKENVKGMDRAVRNSLFLQFCDCHTLDLRTKVRALEIYSKKK